MKKLLVFTDLDGSLLDHHDYSWLEALPALNALEQQLFPVIFNSSKTATEIVALKKQLKNYAPFISENGALATIPRNYFSRENFEYKLHIDFDTHYLSPSYTRVTDILNRLREKHRFRFRGFNDMSVEEVSIETGLDKAQALAAKQRQASEPMQWLDDEVRLGEFKSLLEDAGLGVTSGGRFMHVMADATKGKAALWIKQQYQQFEPETQWLTAGLGDSHNDIAMLEVVDYPVLISNPATRQPDVSHINNLARPDLPGPAGWNKAVLDIINDVRNGV